MKKEELMIGDWVMFDHNPVRVAILGAADHSLGLAAGKTVFGQPFSMIDPIPLTEEILQRHFPDPDEITWFPLDEQPGVFNIYWEHPTFGEGEARLNLRYVHELQHLLRMIKSDKEVRP